MLIEAPREHAAQIMNIRRSITQPPRRRFGCEKYHVSREGLKRPKCHDDHARIGPSSNRGTRTRRLWCQITASRQVGGARIALMTPTVPLWKFAASGRQPRVTGFAAAVGLTPRGELIILDTWHSRPPGIPGIPGIPDVPVPLHPGGVEEQGDAMKTKTIRPLLVTVLSGAGRADCLHIHVGRRRRHLAMKRIWTRRSRAGDGDIQLRPGDDYRHQHQNHQREHHDRWHRRDHDQWRQ